MITDITTPFTRDVSFLVASLFFDIVRKLRNKRIYYEYSVRMDLVFRNYCAMKVDSDVKSITTIQNSVALSKVVGANSLKR